MKKPSVKQRFLNKIIKTKSCWIWNAGLFSSGYGQFFNGKNKITAHRYSYILHNGTIENNKLVVCHSCDNKKCVNPEHLFLGTQKQNIRDMMSKNRQKFGKHPGQLNGRAKITKKQVDEIRKKYYNEKISALKLGKEYNISESQTLRIIKKQSWRE